MEYAYDETVLDSTTEHVHRFYGEHSKLSCRESDMSSEGTNEASALQRSVNGRSSNNNSWCLKRNKGAPLRSILGRRHSDTASKFKHIKWNSTQKRRGSAIPGLIDFRKSNKHKETQESLGITTLQRENSIVLQRTESTKSNWLERTLSRRATGSAGSWGRKRPSAALVREIKAARQLGVIMGAFTLCFTPYFVLFMVVAFCDGCVSPDLMLGM